MVMEYWITYTADLAKVRFHQSSSEVGLNLNLEEQERCTAIWPAVRPGDLCGLVEAVGWIGAPSQALASLFRKCIAPQAACVYGVR